MNGQLQPQPEGTPREWRILLDRENSEILIYHPSYQSPRSKLTPWQEIAPIYTRIIGRRKIRDEDSYPTSYQLTRSEFNGWQDIFSIIDDTIPPGREHDSLIRRLIYSPYQSSNVREEYEEYCFMAVTGNKEGDQDVI